jgi:hypothetical protein
MKERKNKIYVKCVRKVCGYNWAPDSRLWRNKANKGEKMFKCPKCSHNVIVPEKTVKLIERNNS